MGFEFFFNIDYKIVKCFPKAMIQKVSWRKIWLALLSRILRTKLNVWIIRHRNKPQGMTIGSNQIGDELQTLTWFNCVLAFFCKILLTQMLTVQRSSWNRQICLSKQINVIPMPWKSIINKFIVGQSNFIKLRVFIIDIAPSAALSFILISVEVVISVSSTYHRAIEKANINERK